MMQTEIYKNPLLLSADNFTPLTRTPWAGDRITSGIKDVVLPNRVGDRVGESWEFSCDPDFPSILTDHQLELIRFIQTYPKEVLGEKMLHGGTKTIEILIKLLNANDPLSLQVHPEDTDKFLKEGECGKPESWLVLNADPGCGIYLGFSKKLNKNELAAVLTCDGDAAKESLQFVEVVAGDYFEISPGVPHAIGPGVTLLEPQRILSGQSGKTYRMWDWGRKYDTSGSLDMVGGSPRELHIEEALRLVDGEEQVGDDFVQSTRRTGKRVHADIPLIVYPDNGYYQVYFLDELTDAQDFQISGDVGYGCLINLGAEIQLTGAGDALMEAPKGQSVLLPNRCFPLKLNMKVGAKWALVTSSGSQPQFDR